MYVYYSSSLYFFDLNLFSQIRHETPLPTIDSASVDTGDGSPVFRVPPNRPATPPVAGPSQSSDYHPDM